MRFANAECRMRSAELWFIFLATTNCGRSLQFNSTHRPSKNGKTAEKGCRFAQNTGSADRSVQIVRDQAARNSNKEMRHGYVVRKNRARRKQDKKREENLKERTNPYVTESCRNATPYCAADSLFLLLGRGEKGLSVGDSQRLHHTVNIPRHKRV